MLVDWETQCKSRLYGQLEDPKGEVPDHITDEMVYPRANIHEIAGEDMVHTALEDMEGCSIMQPFLNQPEADLSYLR